jgi:hypothetical protein
MAESVGSVLPPPVGPIVEALGMAAQIASMFMGDPRQERATAETNTAMAARYTAPTPTHYMQDTYGNSAALNMQGGFQPLVQVTQNISAIDSKSFNDHQGEIANATAAAIENAISPRLSAALRNTVSPQ